MTKTFSDRFHISEFVSHRDDISTTLTTQQKSLTEYKYTKETWVKLETSSARSQRSAENMVQDTETWQGTNRVNCREGNTA